MNNKILVGSIVSVAILILVSFTSVVGYRSVDSDVKASPLFNIRSSRAIDEESGGLSCEYVGKGNGINLLIPDRDDEKDKIREFIEIIQETDDESISRIIDLIYQYNNNEYTSKPIFCIITELISSILAILFTPIVIIVILISMLLGYVPPTIRPPPFCPE